MLSNTNTTIGDIVSTEKGGETSNVEVFDALFPPSQPPATVEDAPKMPTWVAPHKPRADGLRPDDLHRVMGDPREELVADHALWVRLLALAFRHDGQKVDGCFALLHCVRSEGATLEKRALRAFVTRGEIEEATWQTYYLPKLRERQEVIVPWLREVNR